MIVPWFTFIAVGLITYAGFLKLAARLLRYNVSWKSVFHFAGIMLIIVIFGHLLTFSEPLALRIGHNVVLLLGLVVLVAGSSESAVQIAAVQFLRGAAACGLWHWRLQLALLWRSRSL